MLSNTYLAGVILNNTVHCVLRTAIVYYVWGNAGVLAAQTLVVCAGSFSYRR